MRGFDCQYLCIKITYEIFCIAINQRKCQNEIWSFTLSFILGKSICEMSVFPDFGIISIYYSSLSEIPSSILRDKSIYLHLLSYIVNI